jgi:hypothetical protein
VPGGKQNGGRGKDGQIVMKVEDLPPQFGGLPDDIRWILATFAEQGFEDAAALINLIRENCGEEETG